MKFYLLCLVAFFVVLTGCSSNSEENNNRNNSKEEGSYAAILNINGEEYYSVGDKNQGEYTVSEEFGRVETRVPPEVLPKENLVSNYLDEGTLIFSVEEDSKIFLSETKEDGVYEIFYKSK
ncbi:hypothetical protein QGM71_20605 [Virgibacillus sp. C22-A2]|uniref:Lipoprotein n=1 Tax=Virgibacillus tibetensis TaxID=3042313 RepID=A0ABU6KLR2_9BACI|nr:hypothetical protein [Virgibacillus sp. C22-A2]